MSNIKVSQLPSYSAPLSGDLFLIVTNTGVSPTSNSITFGSVTSGLQGQITALQGQSGLYYLLTNPSGFYNSGSNTFFGNTNVNNLQINQTLSFTPSGNSTSSLTLGSSNFYFNTYTGLSTWTMPAISSCTGRSYMIKNKANILTLTGNGSDMFFGAATSSSYIVNSGESYILVNDGINWSVI